MCDAIAILASDVPLDLIAKFNLRPHLHLNGNIHEFRFRFRSRHPRLPFFVEGEGNGELAFARWGNGRGQSRFLPKSGYTTLGELKDGTWRNIDIRRVIIPATKGLDGRGVWYPIHIGVRGILVPDEKGWAVVYMVREESSNYYRNKCGSDMMPVLVDQRY